MKFTDYATSLNMKYNYARQHLKDFAFVYAVSHFTYDLCEKVSPETLKKVYSGLEEADKSQQYRSEEHTSELQSRSECVCQILRVKNK